MQQNSQSQSGPHGMSMHGRGPGFLILMGFAAKTGVVCCSWLHILLIIGDSGICGVFQRCLLPLRPVVHTLIQVLLACIALRDF